MSATEAACSDIIELLDESGYTVESDEPMANMRAVNVDGFFFDVRSPTGELLTVEVTRAGG